MVFCALYALLTQCRLIPIISTYGWDFEPIRDVYEFRARRIFYLGRGQGPKSEIHFVFSFIVHLSVICADAVSLWTDLCVHISAIMVFNIVSDFQTYLNEDPKVEEVRIFN